MPGSLLWEWPPACHAPIRAMVFLGAGGRYLRWSSPAGRLTPLSRVVSCVRSKMQCVSLGTEVSYWRDSSRVPPPLLLSLRTGSGHSRELHQLEGLAQASGQSECVLLSEVALAQPERGGQEKSLRGSGGCWLHFLPVFLRTNWVLWSYEAFIRQRPGLEPMGGERCSSCLGS